ncbi:MAG TPA: M50 family metallopeptidase [Nocardioidaceae bacterium]|nr:M50 family metallopeptidase [Nocardioidaceae bacterium]
MELIAEIWDRVTTTQPRPSDTVVLATAVLAGALVVVRPAWALSRHLVTIAHEGAHGIAAALSGRRLGGIRLHSDTSGLTVSSGRPRGLGMVVTAAAGYAGPASIGLAAAYLLSVGHAVAVLWLVLAALALLLVQIRNFFGLWSVLVTAAPVFAISWWLPERAQSAFAYLLTWFLLIAAPRPVLEMQAARRRHRARTSDADQLARLTHLPALVWVGVFLLVAVGTLALGAGLLLR